MPGGDTAHHDVLCRGAAGSRRAVPRGERAGGAGRARGRGCAERWLCGARGGRGRRRWVAAAETPAVRMTMRVGGLVTLLCVDTSPVILNLRVSSTYFLD